MVERVFEEKASGARWDRPELQRLMDQLRPGDVVVVWKLDRLSRSLKDLLILMERIDQAGAGFRSLTESIDTTAGMLLFGALCKNTLIGVVGQHRRKYALRSTLR